MLNTALHFVEVLNASFFTEQIVCGCVNFLVGMCIQGVRSKSFQARSEKHDLKRSPWWPNQSEYLCTRYNVFRCTTLIVRTFHFFTRKICDFGECRTWEMFDQLPTNWRGYSSAMHIFRQMTSRKLARCSTALTREFCGDGSESSQNMSESKRGELALGMKYKRQRPKMFYWEDMEKIRKCQYMKNNSSNNARKFCRP